MERFEIVTFERHNPFSRSAGQGIHQGLTATDVTARLKKAKLSDAEAATLMAKATAGQTVSYRNEDELLCQVTRYIKD